MPLSSRRRASASTGDSANGGRCHSGGLLLTAPVIQIQPIQPLILIFFRMLSAKGAVCPLQIFELAGSLLCQVFGRQQQHRRREVLVAQLLDTPAHEPVRTLLELPDESPRFSGARQRAEIREKGGLWRAA